MGGKRQVTLSQGDLKVTLHLCRLSLNPSVYNALQAKRKAKEQWANYPVVRSEIRTFSFDDVLTDHQVHGRQRVCGPGARPDDRGVVGQSRLQWRFGVLPIRFPEICCDPDSSSH